MAWYGFRIVYALYQLSRLSWLSWGRGARFATSTARQFLRQSASVPAYIRLVSIIARAVLLFLRIIHHFSWMIKQGPPIYGISQLRITLGWPSCAFSTSQLMVLLIIIMPDLVSDFRLVVSWFWYQRDCEPILTTTDSYSAICDEVHVLNAFRPFSNCFPPSITICIVLALATSLFAPFVILFNPSGHFHLLCIYIRVRGVYLDLNKQDFIDFCVCNCDTLAIFYRHYVWVVIIVPRSIRRHT